MNILEAYITIQNARHADNFFPVVVDAAHWAEYDVYTPVQYDHYMAVATYRDAYKEQCGCRPRGDMSKLTAAYIWAEVDAIYNRMAEEQKTEAEREADNKAAYEDAIKYVPNNALQEAFNHARDLAQVAAYEADIAIQEAA